MWDKLHEQLPSAVLSNNWMQWELLRLQRLRREIQLWDVGKELYGSELQCAGVVFLRRQ
jgi:hypothetical protein